MNALALSSNCISTANIEDLKMEFVKPSLRGDSDIFFGMQTQDFTTITYKENEWSVSDLHSNLSGVVAVFLVQKARQDYVSSFYHSERLLYNIGVLIRMYVNSYQGADIFNDDCKIFFEKVRYYQEIKNDRLALRTIYSVMEDSLSVKNYSLPNKILSEINVAEFNLTILIAFLSSTFMWKNNLPARKELYVAIKKHAEALRVDNKFMRIYAGLE
jgi:hypothetical protein